MPVESLSSKAAARILVVDDQRANAEKMAGVLRARGYEVTVALDGAAALDLVHSTQPDLVVADILMPGLDGYAFCRRLRSDPATALLPVVLVTSLEAQGERTRGLEAGADDFLSKPVKWDELFARVRSLLRVKALQDELRAWNQQLEARVREQVSQLEQLSRLKRFFSGAVAEAIAEGREEMLKPHRREITAVFLDLRGFTSFTDRADPDEVVELLRVYHVALGREVDKYGATLEHFAGDGIMIFFNDPLPVEQLGHEVGLGIGIAQGEATLGVIGFENRWEYAAIGNVPNLAARLCGAARAGEIMLDAQTEQDLQHMAETEAIEPLRLRGFQQPVVAFRLKSLK
jgi:adenylate cyclase